MIGLVLAVALVAAESGRDGMKDNVPDDFDHRIENFRQRIGFSKLSQVTGPDGVKADWEELHRSLSAQLKPLRPQFSATNVSEAGLADADWTWRRGGSAVTVQLFVSGAGPKTAQEKMFSLGSQTSMVRIPYEAGPPNFGDLSIHSPRHLSSMRIWVYRNVCARVDNQGGTIDVEPIARAIQHFMEAHLVPRVAIYLPRIDRVDVSAKQIHVGEEWSLAVELGKETPLESVMTEIKEEDDLTLVAVWSRLKSVKRAPLAVTYRAVTPGTARVEIRVADRKTLLSPPLSVTVEVLPAR